MRKANPDSLVRRASIARTLFAIAFFAALLTTKAAALQTPEEVTKQYFAFVQEKKWDDVASLYAPSALADFRNAMSFLLELPPETSAEVLTTFFGPEATRESVTEMSDADFFASFVRLMMSQVADTSTIDFGAVQVLGSIPEGEATQHVVVRTKVGVGAVAVEALEVVSYRREKNRWGMLLQGKISGIAQQMKDAMRVATR